MLYSHFFKIEIFPPRDERGCHNVRGQEKSECCDIHKTPLQYYKSSHSCLGDKILQPAGQSVSYTRQTRTDAFMISWKRVGFQVMWLSWFIMLLQAHQTNWLTRLDLVDLLLGLLLACYLFTPPRKSHHNETIV